jgi:hypothetical protein
MKISPVIGNKYYRVSGIKARVIEVVSITDGWVTAKTLHGPSQLQRKGFRCKEKNFSSWAPCPDLDDYSWKEHFLESMNPQHMPKGWDIISVKNMEAADEINNQCT